MAQYGEDYGKQTDEYGNPIHRSEEAGGEEYGSTGKTGQYGATGGGYGTEKYGTTGAHPTGQHGETGGAYGTEQYGNTGATGGGYGTEQYGNTGATGGGYGTDQYGNTGATGGGYGTEKYGTTGAHPTGQHGGGIGLGTTDAGVTGGGHRRSGSSSSEDDGQGGRRKKGLKDKIKEKLPGGGHKDDEYQSQYDPTATTGGAGEYGGGAGEYGGGAGEYGGGAEHEKKGFMEKIKDKLPGGGD